MPTETVRPVSPLRERSSSAASPSAEQHAGFEGALQRARRGAAGEEAVAADPPPLAPPFDRHDEPPADNAPLTAARVERSAEVAALAARRAPLEASDTSLRPGAWQVQLGEAGLPVRALEMQRAEGGVLQVALGAAMPEALRPQAIERLRQRLGPRVQVNRRHPGDPET